MNYIEYATWTAEDERVNLKRKALGFATYLREIADRIETEQKLIEERDPDGVVDVEQAAMSWIRSQYQQVEWQQRRYVEAHAKLQAIKEIAFAVDCGKISVDTLIAAGPTDAERSH